MKVVYTHWDFCGESLYDPYVHMVVEFPGAFQWDF